MGKKKKEQEVKHSRPVVLKVKKLTFEQYVARRNHIRSHHVAGLKAFVKNVEKLRTEAEWDSVFSSY